MDSISALREATLRALAPSSTLHHEQDLFDALAVHKPKLLKLLHVEPRNAQEQREIESGKTTIGGKAVAINGDSTRQVIFLSQQLDCSEKLIAELVYSVTSEHPNMDSKHCLEAVVSQLHSNRRDLVDCLQFLFQAAEYAGSPQASPLHERIRSFVYEELVPGLSPAGGQLTLPYRLFKELEGLDVLLAKALTAKRNAGSTTVPPAPQTQGALGADVLEGRYNSIKYERRGLANAFCFLARMGYLSPNEIRLVVEWLMANPNHPMTFYVLTSFLVALDPATPQTRTAHLRNKLASDAGLVAFMSQKLGPTTAWRDQGLKGTLLLKWTLFLTEMRHRDPALEHRNGFKTEELETQIWNAVQGDTFMFLSIAMLQLYRGHGNGLTAALVDIHDISPEQLEQRDVPEDSFMPFILSAFETLVRCLFMHASSELRKIKQRQEDLVHANARTERARGASHRYGSTLGPDNAHPPRNDIAMLYTFIGLLYSALPVESALQFWGSVPQVENYQPSYLELVEAEAGKLPNFLQWAIWSTPMQDYVTLTALYDMLSGLSKGQHCSELAYNFLARGGGEILPGSVLPSSSAGGQTITWTVIFGLLDSWAAQSANPRTPVEQNPFGQTFGGLSSLHAPPPPVQHQSSHQVIGPRDVLLAQAFLRLLSAVVTHSEAVRVAVSGHAQFRAIPTLLSLIPLGVPLELKGAVFETLAAFCSPGAGSAGVEICKAVWTLMERLEVINVRAGPSGPYASTLSTVKGVEVELEEIEAVHRLYPATIPFLKLLSTLIHTSKRIPLSKRISDAEPLNTIPETLGQPYRLPGIGPFTSFVIDNVFARIPNREYAHPSDRWQINDLCLCFIERALASFDLESLAGIVEEAPLRTDALVPLFVHPGYDITKRLLTTSLLQNSILSYIVEGVEGFEKNYAEEEPYYRSTMVRVLRIVNRIMEIQDIFLDVLVPLLSELDATPIVGTVHPRSYFTKFDQALSFGSQYAPAIAAYLTFPTHEELVLLSVKILTKLSVSPYFNNLATLIERSRESDRILFGFTQLIAQETTEDVRDAEALAEQTTGAGAPDINGSNLSQAIKVAALDLLVQDTDPGRPYPNVSHFLLFGSSKSGYHIQDPLALGARRTSVHVIIHLVSIGISRLKGKGKAHERHLQDMEPLFASQPGLAEKCYRVLYQLCMHPQTSDPTTRYLRTREDFFARQLNAMPFLVPEAIRESYIQLLYTDGSRTTTTVPFLAAFLRLRSCVFDLVALELHILTNKGHLKAVTDLLDILFGIPGFQDDTYDNDTFQPFMEVGQSHMRVIEFLRSLMFDWSDSLVVQPLQVQFLNQLNLSSCLRTDARGCEIVDRNALIALLTTARRTLRSQGAIATAAQSEQLNKETSYVLESCAIENHRREVTQAVAVSYEAWRRLLDMSLTKCFDRLPRDSRENMLFDLLHILPPAISTPDLDQATAVLLSETTLSTITKLREDRRHQIIIQSAGGDAEAGALPAERLYSILRSILEGILDNSRVELVRGNLYAALINYIHLIVSSHTPTTSDPSKLIQGSSSDLVPFNGSQALVHLPTSGSTANLEAGSLNVMKPAIDRLVSVISRDAIDGTEVWKTIAFMLLDALVQLSGTEKQHVVLGPLTRHGILSNFVQGIREADGRLQAVLKPDPDDLNALYVYESKMSLFIRMSQTRAGAERLLDSRLIPTLAQCDFLDARPEADQSFIDQDSFLPSAIQRYHQLIMPALQLLDGMIATLGGKHKTMVHQALDFLASHGATIAILLKNETEYNTVSLLDEIHLIVLLCMNVLPAVPKSEVLSPTSGFGAIHSAVLTLSTRSLGRGQCFANIVPITDAEVENARNVAFGFGSETKFELSVRRKEKLLRKSIVAYIGAANEFTEPEITVVLSPMTTASRQGERGHFSTTIPTLGDAVEALNDLCGELGETLKQIVDLSAELSSKEHIDVENVREAVQDIPSIFLQDLDVSQKRALICQELKHVRESVRRDVKVLLDTTEMLLLIIWRHLDYYTSPSHTLPLPPTSSTSSSTTNALTTNAGGSTTTTRGLPNVSSTTLHALRFLTTPPDPSSIKSEMGKKLSPGLIRLGTLGSELNEDTLGGVVAEVEGGLGNGNGGTGIGTSNNTSTRSGSAIGDWVARRGFLEIMVRRIRDVTGLHSDDDDGGDEGGEMVEEDMEDSMIGVGGGGGFGESRFGRR
ncbi:hypothetical protein BDN72DRAFT_959281 [Pluteus cervinus]|uniref:Uncharacterized protein n=1 Tax=Pluteus cervinus TaxID=181527 RepID=A0ACD3AVK1_9AGAR|nr:hypothetical protein BDN72DRAFT_959281 [Pluteus cervinus]